MSSGETPQRAGDTAASSDERPGTPRSGRHARVAPAPDPTVPVERVPPPSEDDDPLVGSFLNSRYRIDGVLGAGGVGVVYRAEHTGLRQQVAVKVLRHGFHDVELVRRRFEREAQVLSALSHPNIVALRDFGIDEGRPYFVMEVLEGITLGDLLDREGPPAPHRALSIARGVLRGLAYAHQMGVLHRDLKPANVFLQRLPDDPDHVRLLDFGLAKLNDPAPTGGQGQPDLTRTGTILGTPAYMAPEQASGARVDARADVYSAGVLLYELMAGEPPFHAERRTDLLRAHLIEPVPDPRDVRPGLELREELEQVLLKALAKEPQDRYADAGELLAAVDALPLAAAVYRPPTDAETSRASTTAPRALDRPKASAEAPTRRWLPWALALAGLLGLAGVALLGSPETPPEPVDEVPGAAAAGAESEESEAVRLVGPIPAAPADLPAELAGLRAQLFAAAELDRATHRALREYQREHPEDARPSLFMAQDYARHMSWRGTVQRYQIAARRDAEVVRADPFAPLALVRVVERGSREDARVATRLLDRLYGRDALGAVRRAYSAATAEGITRLDALEAALRR
ncbi:MAG: serine/threonine-protein kinase [Myxococcota bacterium]